MKICSACQLGINCRYSGKIKENRKVVRLSKKEILSPVCPEQLGGLRTPRAAAEINNRRVINNNGMDCTKEFKKGVDEASKIVTLYGIDKAILKQGSPSCGCGEIYNGTFSGKKFKEKVLQLNC